MKRSALAGLLGLIPLLALAQQPLLAPEPWRLLRDEASGAAPYETLRSLTQLHRVPGTAAFDQAAALIAAKARDYGLAEVSVEQFPIDGKIAYGLMRSHLGWTVDLASLWQTAPLHVLLGDWADQPIRLADYSHSTDVETTLVDVGAGASAADYQGKDVRGRIVLADGPLARVQQLAVMTYGAAGIVSDMPNQATAWSGLDPDLIRWGHLDASLPTGFAFMVSPAAATDLRRQLGAGQTVRLQARVKAEVGPGHWTVVSAMIAGRDAAAGEIVYSCHLDHQRPGANDNGSGCVTTLEVARLLTRLIDSGRLPRPKRSLHFIWGPEVEGTMAYLARHPERLRLMRADIHMDMVGGDPFKDKAVLHITETPWSLPSIVTDIGDLLAGAIKDGARHYAEEGDDAAAAVLENRAGAEGSRNLFWADRTPYAEGSDHDDYDSSTIAVPSLYLRDWPDINIHTDHDRLDQIDPTKLRRVALLGAAAGYVLGGLDNGALPTLLPLLAARGSARLAQGYAGAQALALDAALSPADAWYEARNLIARRLEREQATLRSLDAFAGDAAATREVSASLAQQAAVLQGWIDRAARQRGADGLAPVAPWPAEPTAARIPRRIGAFGPLTYQNDDVLADRLGRERVQRLALLGSSGNRLLRVQDQGALYAYEIVNFVDGRRSVGDIRDAVAAEFGPLPLAVVAEYLEACAEAGIIEWTAP